MSGPSPRFLLLQARLEGDEMARHEHECFYKALEVPEASVKCWNLLQGPPTERELDQTDLLLIGGSGHFSVCDDDPFIHQFLDFLGDVCVARRFPTFASCFGFQGLVVAGGGEVIHDVPNTEVGTFDIFVSEEGLKDPLLGDIGPSFKAQLGHKDRATRLPAGMTHLASSALVSYQCVRVGDSDVFGTQFHPELTRQANTLRYLRYQAGYVEAEPDRPEDQVLQSMEESPLATALLPRWMNAALSRS